MDAKITKARLNDMFAYDWIKIIALTVAIVCAWSLLYAFTGVRLSNGQSFEFVVRSTSYDRDEISSFTKALGNDKVFSYDIQSITYEIVDPRNNEDNIALEAAMMTGKGDLMIVGDYALLDADGNFIVNENNAIQPSDFKAYVDRNVICSIEDMITAAKQYCSQFYVGADVSGNGELNEEYLESNFRKRVKKDNRFRKEKDIIKGIAGERERIQNYLEQALLLEQTLNLYPEIGTKYSKNEQSSKLWPENGYVVGEEKIYGIDLYKINGAKNMVRGENVTDCKGMMIAFINFDRLNGDLFYESISAMNYFISRYGPVRV